MFKFFQRADSLTKTKPEEDSQQKGLVILKSVQFSSRLLPCVA